MPEVDGCTRIVVVPVQASSLNQVGLRMAAATPQMLFRPMLFSLPSARLLTVL